MPRARSCASSSNAGPSATCSSWDGWTGSSSSRPSHPGSYAESTLADPLAPPGDLLEACVVLPVHDDDAALGPALRALAEQEGVSHETYEVIVVLAGCRDALRAEAVAAGDEHPGLRLTLLSTGDAGDAAARRTGMDLACHRLLAIGRDHGRILLADPLEAVGRSWLA